INRIARKMEQMDRMPDNSPITTSDHDDGHSHDPEHGHHDAHVHHPHSHSHHGHDHPPLRPSVLAWAMVATLGLVVAEIFGGILGRSVALLNDAVHNLSDVPALGISWLAMRWAERPVDSEKT